MEIIHKAGKKHTNADALSRVRFEETINTAGEYWNGKNYKKMKGITKKKREIKLKNLLYKEYLERKYIVYDYQKYRIKVRKDTGPRTLLK